MANDDDKYYVSMIDSFMSGWGKSTFKKNVLIFICDSYKQAEIVESNANARSDIKNVEIHGSKPEFNEEIYFVQYKNIEVYPNWYKDGSFEEKPKNNRNFVEGR